MSQNAHQKKTTRIPIRMRRTDENEMHTILRHTSARTKNRAFQYAIRLFCDMWRLAQQRQKIIVVHASTGHKATLNIPSTTLPRVTGIGEKEPARGKQTIGIFELRLEPEETNALEILLDNGVSASRADLLRRALAYYAFVAAYAAEGWVLYAEKTEANRWPISIPGIRLLFPS